MCSAIQTEVCKKDNVIVLVLLSRSSVCFYNLNNLLSAILQKVSVYIAQVYSNSGNVCIFVKLNIMLKYLTHFHGEFCFHNKNFKLNRDVLKWLDFQFKTNTQFRCQSDDFSNTLHFETFFSLNNSGILAFKTHYSKYFD